ncbi:MAG: CpsD/CapB family tyrosine-protein kinase [Vicinamibacterales bacterium]
MAVVTGIFDSLRAAPGPPPTGSESARPWPVSPRVVELPPPTTSVPVNGHKWLANVPVAKDAGTAPDQEGLQFTEDVAQKLVIDERSPPAAVEQYRRLAAALHHSQRQFGTKVVMVASAINAEGKSLSVCNIALTLSHSYRKRVLLIDADLRHPGLHETFQLPMTTGLSEALRASADRALPLFDVTGGLVVLPAGRPDPDPLGGLASDRMANIINEASTEFDWVLIDTPPVGLVPDAKLLAAVADAVVLVIRAGRSPCVLVQQTIEALGAEKVIGVLLNATEGASTRRQNSYYRYGYGYGPRRP